MEERNPAPAQSPGEPPPPAAAPEADRSALAARTPEGSGAEGGSLDMGGALSFQGSAGVSDGVVEVSIAGDGMSAMATFFPPRGDGLPIEPSVVQELLRRIGVVWGILEEAITEAVMGCNLDRRILRDVVVARGSAPVSEVPEHASLEPKFRRMGPQVSSEVQRVDFRELATMFIVSSGETIATVQPKRPGAPGTDVRGRETPFSRESPENCAAGRNVERIEDRLVAKVDGRLSIESGRADIDEVLLVKGEVDFHTGHILFPGDVVIEGVVHDGFKVHSGGSIVCKSTVDAFDVSARKDLICSQGIIGRRRGEVRAGGEIRAKYIQNCRVAARGDIKVTSAVVNSRVYTLGRLDLGDKGVLMGGEAVAAHGIRCGRIGNEAYQPTRLHVGVDFTARQRLDQANARMRLASARLRQADAAYAARPLPEIAKAREELAKLAADIRALIAELLGRQDADPEATVEAKGEIFPGVTIEICRVSIVVEEKLHACRFRLDKAAGRLVMDR